MNTYFIMAKIISYHHLTKERLLLYCDVFMLNQRINADEYTDLLELINSEYPDNKTEEVNNDSDKE